MPAETRVRGHVIAFRGERWVYADTGEPATDSTERPCVACGRVPGPDGADPCLGNLPGVTAACCGHGVEAGYVMRDGERYPLTETTDG